MRNILKDILENRKKSLEQQKKEIDKLLESERIKKRKPISECIKNSNEISIISEIKPSSPSLGDIRKNIDVRNISKEMEDAGVIGLSVLTEPNYFHGSFNNLRIAVESTNLPCLMKDFVFSEVQFRIAQNLGATNILLINLLGNMEELCEYATKYDLEPLIEIHNLREIYDIQKIIEIGFNPKLIGVNNRNLETLDIDLNQSKKIIPKLKETIVDNYKVVSESGVNELKDIKFLLDYNADVFLIGSSIMKSTNIKQKIKELRGVD